MARGDDVLDVRPRSRPDDGLRAMLRQHLTRCQFTTIETGSVELGVPDVHVLFEGGIDVWIECKATRDGGSSVKMRPGQMGWLLKRSRMGGRCWVAVRRRCSAGPRRKARDELWLLPGALAGELHLHGIDGVFALDGVVGHFGGPSQWNWRRIQETLTS